MGKITRPKKAKLFIGVIFKDIDLLDAVKKNLSHKFGQIDFESELLDFKYTDYYKKEFGQNLKRKFISFSELIPPEEISAIKTITGKLEKGFSEKNKRRINLDPGYLNAAKVVLATTKDYSHRIYLRHGIYAEVTLIFNKGVFRPYPWAYPDYQSPEYLDIFNQMRKLFIKQRD